MGWDGWDGKGVEGSRRLRRAALRFCLEPRQLYLPALGYAGADGDTCYGPAIIPDLTSLGGSKLGQMFVTLGFSPIHAGVFVTFLGPFWYIFGAARGLSDVSSKRAKATYTTVSERGPSHRNMTHW